MFDPPHLLKSSRNNFFNYRIVFGNKIIESKYLKQFYNSDSQRTHCLAPNLTEKHMNPGPFQKMKVKFASQVFSKTVICAMTTCMADGSIQNTTTSTIQFIDSATCSDDLYIKYNTRR
ncbi:histone H1-II-like [Aphis craccivora]|uniref:Histone H1-II-like n=1 Tax=Aphis craccivora TaxID=307492 RepID=A0A6G0XZY1_APHCR|nr:histone H1-II-like [Aphis craccivora]